jgi:hypothetical protein
MAGLTANRRSICIAVRPRNGAVSKTRPHGKWAFTLTLFVISI